MPDYLLKALFALTGFLLLYALYSILPQARHPALRALLHGTAGLTSLLLGNALGAPFGLGLGLNVLTIPASLVLGVPGTALLWTLRYLL